MRDKEGQQTKNSKKEVVEVLESNREENTSHVIRSHECRKRHISKDSPMALPHQLPWRNSCTLTGSLNPGGDSDFRFISAPASNTAILLSLGKGQCMFADRFFFFFPEISFQLHKDSCKEN